MHFASNFGWKSCLGLCAALLLIGLSGCNTIEGMGKDISSAGNAIEGAAKKSK